jgi:hypothetical protein
MVEYYSICYIIPLVTERIQCPFCGKSLDLNKPIFKPNYPNQENSDFLWEVGQQIRTATNLAKITTKVVHFQGGKDVPWYKIQSGELTLEMTQAALLKLTGENGIWEIIPKE